MVVQLQLGLTFICLCAKSPGRKAILGESQLTKQPSAISQHDGLGMNIHGIYGYINECLKCSGSERYEVDLAADITCS